MVLPGALLLKAGHGVHSKAMSPLNVLARQSAIACASDLGMSPLAQVAKGPATAWCSQHRGATY